MIQQKWCRWICRYQIWQYHHKLRHLIPHHSLRHQQLVPQHDRHQCMYQRKGKLNSLKNPKTNNLYLDFFISIKLALVAVFEYIISLRLHVYFMNLFNCIYITRTWSRISLIVKEKMNINSIQTYHFLAGYCYDLRIGNVTYKKNWWIF